jgi:hypothetical protein
VIDSVNVAAIGVDMLVLLALLVLVAVNAVMVVRGGLYAETVHVLLEQVAVDAVTVCALFG